MKKLKRSIHFLFVSLTCSSFIITFQACSTDDDTEVTTEEFDDSNFETLDWTTTTHSNEVDPNMDEVFDNNTVKKLEIVITETRWQSMLDTMTETYGTFGAGANSESIDTEEGAIFVPSEVFYNGLEWYRVGLSFNENSSLQRSWQNGILKLSFKLDFDFFGDAYPQIDAQRFYGFKKLNLKNNFDNKSMLQENGTTDTSSYSVLVAFYKVYIDHGDGSEYFGLYTLVQEVDETV
ncbi:CotH kinase family protein [Lacinutrix himadriensis]|uniref:CotH kinase family protein n=1 Tax=Lacinutrix himadriensis TaxID=641549 RepID=UPI000AB1CA72|nr:CotH kinase family protein [Lacinutrix himadriensis]